ncbi:hypothetical protein [Candidatus Electrothrix sp.]|uniref:hypothetical protein n=1 Tax=Candidatus Electrothrix sp. TaxID=2170559 RepID=UPI004055CC05
MMKKKQLSLMIVMFICSLSARAEAGVESLSSELRVLLVKEMVALQNGMQSIFPSYVSGDFEQVSVTAKKIKNSFILKQQITDAQKKELGSKLPNSFMSMDKKFHKYAGKLEHAAEIQSAELIGFYYSKLTESCVACHMKYAKHRFPNFNTKSQSDE